MGDLKPCPFCGSTKIDLLCHAKVGSSVDHWRQDVWTIGCYNCGCSFPGRYEEKGKWLIVDAWNRRATPPEFERLRDALDDLLEAYESGMRTGEDWGSGDRARVALKGHSNE